MSASIWNPGSNINVSDSSGYVESIFRYLSATKIAAIQAYSYSQNVTDEIATAIAQGFEDGAVRLFFPAGGYIADIDFIVKALGSSVLTEYRGIPITFIGAGNGEPFVTSRSLNRGTLIAAASANTPALRIRQDSGNPTGTSGTIRISGIRFESTTTSDPVVDIESFCGQSLLDNCTIYQLSTGAGLKIGQMSTGAINQVHVLNTDQFVIGGTKTGKGVEILQPDNNNGLPYLHKVTSRGWEYAYVLGNGVNRTYIPKLDDCEASCVSYGVLINPFTSQAVIDTLYCEGVSETCIVDHGEDTKVTNSQFLIGYKVGIDGDYTSPGSAYGRVYSNNYLEANDDHNVDMVRVTSSGTSGGPGTVVTHNRFLYSGSGAVTVNGLVISGSDPRVDYSGNTFLPRGDWLGAGKKILDNSTSSDGTTGSGIYGLGVAESTSRAVEVQQLGRGALNLAVESTVISSVSAGVATLSGLSIHTVTFGAATNITSFASANLPDKTFSIHITNGNATLKQGALLKLSGSVDYTPTAAGSFHTFQVKPGGMCYEIARIAY